ncbi:hypothetical protein AK88_05582 [Plasmodium fragile]|uniref:Uncharacterized protein n=1 Tax=Plasmodium fragile TaxID=5857 RepID=A0A0D9QCT0_PLAFR|nr:uncharacterized protein AK88_05582 [Plasmodium fragile]KJP84784.1 hypothetical protein AK88_05582 [Plasmodium fragile]
MFRANPRIFAPSFSLYNGTLKLKYAIIFLEYPCTSQNSTLQSIKSQTMNSAHEVCFLNNNTLNGNPSIHHTKNYINISALQRTMHFGTFARFISNENQQEYFINNSNSGHASTLQVAIH